MQMYSQIANNKRSSLVLVAVFVALLSGLGYILSRAFARPGFFVAILIFAIVYAFISYFASAKIALSMSGAKEIAKADAPELYRIVENLSIAAGQPMPKVYIIDDPSPNAFATGRDPEHAVVAVTTGILKRLEKSELEGVLAHELSHVGNYDIRFMAIVVALVSVVSIITDLFLNISFWGGGDDEEGGNQLFMILGIVAAILAPIVAAILQLAISRKREYLADSSGALLTRNPDGLARALEKISHDDEGMKKVSSSTAPLYFSNPLRRRSGLAGLFDTHPPIEERIRRLREMEGQV
jgi:heat shock protein HtpX